MKNPTAILSLALCTSAATLPVCLAAHATDVKVMTNADPAASAASSGTARRTLKFKTSHAVPATLTLSRATPRMM